MLKLLQADITTLSVDVIVNAANSTLMGGGGVDGAIHRAGGPEILRACKEIIAKIQFLPAGEAVITPGGKLKARYVIHTVGPVWQGGSKNEKSILASAYRKSLELAEAHSLASIAFPSISTGAYRYPPGEAAEVALDVCRSFLTTAEKVKEITLVQFSAEDHQRYVRVSGGKFS